MPSFPLVQSVQTSRSELIATSKAAGHAVPSPTVTRITIPNSNDHAPEESPGMSSNTQTPESSYDDEDIAPPVTDLDDLWGSLRQKKAKKMAKERCKVQSLEEREASEFEPVELPGMQTGPLATFDRSKEEDSLMSKPPVKRQKSVTSFRESPDGRTVVASFDMRGVLKENVHVSFQRNRLVVTWVSVEVSEWQDTDGYLVRERNEKNFQRTLPLPEGTRFEEITGAMSGKHLLIRYPNSRSFRVEAHSVSGGS